MRRESPDHGSDGLVARLRQAGHLVVAAVVPPRCGICAAPCGAAERACAGCRAELRAARPGVGSLPGVERLLWAAPYEGTPRGLVSALKFGGRVALAELAAELVAAPLGTRCGDPRLPVTVVPVPAAPLRRRRRGFDPAELIAWHLATILGLRFSSCLRRADDRRQVGRRREPRLADPPRVLAPGKVPASALLVDDVLTTGATLRSCAAALRGAGAVRVQAAVFARALGPGPGPA